MSLTIAMLFEPIAGFSLNKSQICNGRKMIIKRKNPSPPTLLIDGINNKIPIRISTAPETTLANGLGKKDGI